MGFFFLSQVCLYSNFVLFCVCLCLMFVPILLLSLFYVMVLSYVGPVLCLVPIFVYPMLILSYICLSHFCPNSIFIYTVHTKNNVKYFFLLLKTSSDLQISIFYILQFRSIDLNYKISSDNNVFFFCRVPESCKDPWNFQKA